MVVAVGLVAGCGGLREPRWGGLSPEGRPLRFEPDVVRYDLDNGLRVALVPDPRSRVVTVDVRYPVGASEDPPDRAGLAHLVRTGGASAVADQLSEAIAEGRPVEDPRALAREVAAVTLADVMALAGADLAGERLVVQIAGPRAVVDAALAAARAAAGPVPP